MAILWNWLLLLGIGIDIGNIIPITLAGEAEPKLADDLKSLMLGSYIANTSYQPPEAWQTELAESLFVNLLTTRNFTNADVNEWSRLGLHLRQASQDGINFAVISEPTPFEGRGHGFYAIRLKSAGDSVVSKVFQAPHRPSDSYTHEIVYELLISSNFAGAGWSTTYRNNVDLCKHNSSYFNSFTTATARAFGEKARVVQLHGFDKHSHETVADVIFSSSKAQLPLPDEFNSIATCLKSSMNPTVWNVFKYPEEIDFLGGTLNVNAAKLYATNKAALFFHVETSKELREQLRVNGNLRQLFYDCF